MAKRTSDALLTTAQQLGSILKSSQDIMRKDKGLNGDSDRLPMLTWVLFLKFLDDMEQTRETEAILEGKPFKLAIAPPYRWRDWAAKEDGITGPELIAFIEQDEAVLPDGSRGAGLFAYLRSLRGDAGRDRRDVIATVFRGTNNRMINGYLLRDLINKVNGIRFQSSEEIHTLSRLYESMLKEMRDSAGDAGEFYTPRPVVQLMVKVLDPRLGETVMDPACGTGGFLVEAFEHLKQQCKRVQDQDILQNASLFGGEAKPLPYLLSQMNLLLHGLELPDIDPLNSLRHKLQELGDKHRVDIILTNPPFGEEEERGIQGNFPDDKQTSETTLLFLQMIMRLLRRKPKPGRAGVFVPYTSIPTNLLFFDRLGSTQEIWYYEQPLPEGRKNYTKTKPLQFEEFADCLVWWHERTENERAWKVPVSEVLKYDATGNLLSVNLDIKNPNGQQDFEHLPPEQLVADIWSKEQRILEILGEIKDVLKQKPSANE